MLWTLLYLCLDDMVFRNFVSWLENQKIRLYKIEDRQALDQVDDPNWSTVAYAKVSRIYQSFSAGK